jgi:hypothetical protein
MRHLFLGSAAALALIASTALVSAQTSGGTSAPAGGGAKGSEAPAATQPREGGSVNAQPAVKGSAAESTAAPAAKTGAAGPDHAGTKSGDMKADSTSKPASGAATSPTAASKEAPAASKDAKNPTADAKAANPTADNKTTGNAATAAVAAPPAEKRSQITTAIKQEKVEEVTNVNFNISIGTAVPASVRYHPLPPRIVEIYPEWRGYDFIVVRGKYIILRPQTREIVYIIEG